MVREKYAKLTPAQKVQVLEYWMKYRCSYPILCEYFSAKWNINITKSTIADIVQQWKKHKNIRGIEKTSYLKDITIKVMKKVIGLVNGIGYSISKQSLHAICIGDVLSRGFNPKPITLEIIESLLQSNKLEQSPCLSSSVKPAENNYYDISYLQSILKITAVPSIFILESFPLLFRCIPCQSVCYSFSSSTTLFYERMEVFCAFSLDGSSKFPMFVTADRFSSLPNAEWSIAQRKRRQYFIHSFQSLTLENSLTHI